MINQTHYRGGDNVAGDKYTVINEKPADRIISQENHESLVRELKNYSGSWIDIEVLTNGKQETIDFSQKLLNIFIESGWNVNFSTTGISITSGNARVTNSGIVFNSKGENLSEPEMIILNWLKSNGWAVSFLPNTGKTKMDISPQE